MATTLNLSVTKVADSASIASNTSKVKIVLTITTSSGTYNETGDTSGSITIDGKTVASLAGKPVYLNTTTTLYSGTHTINHDDDGSKTITVKASFDVNTSVRWIYDTVELKLDTIPRAATLDSLSCATKYFTGKLTYKYTPKSASFYNRCNISLNMDGTFVAVKSILLGKKTAAQQTATVTLSADELATVYNELPKTDEGVLRFTFRTYSDSDYSTQVGDAAAKDITLYIPETEDTLPTPGMTLAPVSSLADTFDGLYIQGKTKVDANFSGSGKHGASIASYSMTVEGKSYSSPYTSDYLAQSGSITVKGTAKDSRGFSNTESKTINVLPYSRPQLLAAAGEDGVICARCDSTGDLSDSGTYLKIKARRSYSKVTSGGVQKNFAIIRYRYKTESGSYGTWKTILAKDATSDTVDTDPLLSGALSVSTTYVVQVGVIDDIGGTSTATYTIPNESVYMHRRAGGKAMGLGKYAEKDNILDVAWDTRVRGDLQLGDDGAAVADFVTEIGLFTTDNGSWRYRKWNSGTYDMSGIFDVQPTESNAFSGGVAYYSDQIQIQLPFAIETIQYTGTPAEQYYWLINAALVNGSEGIIGFRLARFSEINTTSPVNVRLVAHGRWK